MFESYDVDMSDYACDHITPVSHADPVRGEKLLWISVLCLALADAAQGKRDAIDWLICDQHDFPMVCNLAGMSPAHIRHASRRYARLLGSKL